MNYASAYRSGFIDTGFISQRKSYPMNNKTKIEGKISTSAVSTYSYANAYAIQTIPLANDEDGVRSTAFIAKESTIQETA